MNEWMNEIIIKINNNENSVENLRFFKKIFVHCNA